MTTVSPLRVNGLAQTQASQDRDRANVDYNAFLRLFIASMKNQDPMKPNDPAQSIAQLASFTNVEQSIKMNERLDALLGISSAELSSSLSMRTLSSLDGSVRGRVRELDSNGIATLEDGGALTYHRATGL